MKVGISGGFEQDQMQSQDWRERLESLPIMFLNIPSVARFAGPYSRAVDSLANTLAILGRYLQTDAKTVIRPTTLGESFEEELVDNLQRLHPRVIGIGNSSESGGAAFKTTNLIREHSPETITIMVGGSGDWTGEYLRSVEGLPDFITVGDGANIFMHLTRIIADNPGASVAEIKLRVLEVRHKIFERIRSTGSLRFVNPKTRVVEHIRTSGIKLLPNTLEGLYALHRKLRERDFYFPDDYGLYFEGKFPAVHLNSASLTVPSHKVWNAAEQVLEAERDGTLSSFEQQAIMARARLQTARLVNLNDERGVALARNTTEAIRLALWLSRLFYADGQRNVVMTNGENLSVQQAAVIHDDHGYPMGSESVSTYPTCYIARGGKRYPDMEVSETGAQVRLMEALAADDATIMQELERAISADTHVLIFSHVLRDTGRELPVREICKKAREIKAKRNPEDPSIFIIVDGAQGLGNVEQIDFEELGCDAYAGSAHKGLGGTPNGILYFDPSKPHIQEALRMLNTLDARTQQIILKNMFHPDLGIRANVDDSLSYGDVMGLIVGLVELQDLGLKENNFSAIISRRRELRTYCAEQLQALAEELGVEMRVVSGPNNTQLILSVHFPDLDGQRIAQGLAELGVFVSYIERNAEDPSANHLRISFKPTNTKRDIDALIRAIRSILSLTVSLQ